MAPMNIMIVTPGMIKLLAYRCIAETDIKKPQTMSKDANNSVAIERIDIANYLCLI